MRSIQFVWRKRPGRWPENEVILELEDLNHKRVATFVAHLNDELGVTGVQLHAESPLTASELQRFAWRKYMKLAVASAAGEPDEELHALMDVFEIAARDRGSIARRPGRSGHPDEHYEEIANLYRKVRGERGPARRIGDALGYSPSTVRGWIAECRSRGLLPSESPATSQSKRAGKPKTKSPAKKVRTKKQATKKGDKR